jgi:hypothetical protein
MAGSANNGGRRSGAKNYKNKVLTNIIAGILILPNGQYGWYQVATAYMTAAKEENLRDTDDLKRHWVKTLCNGMKKPTGGTGEKGERIQKCIAIEKLILDKTHSGILGLSPDEDEEGGGSNSDTSGNNYTTEVAPSPPPPVEGETKEDEDNELSEIELARILNSSMTDTPGDTFNFPRPPSRFSSTAARPPKNQKTKISSNKNRDRTFQIPTYVLSFEPYVETRVPVSTCVSFGLLISGGCHVELLQIHPIPPAIIPISSSNAPAPRTSTLDILLYHRSSGLSSVIESSPRLPPPNGGTDPPTLLPPYVSRSSSHCYRRPLC